MNIYHLLLSTRYPMWSHASYSHYRSLLFVCVHFLLREEDLFKSTKNYVQDRDKIRYDKK